MSDIPVRLGQKGMRKAAREGATRRLPRPEVDGNVWFGLLAGSGAWGTGR